MMIAPSLSKKIAICAWPAIARSATAGLKMLVRKGVRVGRREGPRGADQVVSQEERG